MARRQQKRCDGKKTARDGDRQISITGIIHMNGSQFYNRTDICIKITVANDAKSATAMVGVAGLEPAASWSRTKRDTKLRHTPAA